MSKPTLGPAAHDIAEPPQPSGSDAMSRRRLHPMKQHNTAEGAMSVDSKIPVHLAMSRPVTVLDASATLRTAATMMRERELGAIPMVDGNGLAGIVSERDLVRTLADGGDADETLVGDIATLKPIAVSPGSSVDGAASLMLEFGIRHIPVVKHGEILGMLSIRDALGALRTPATARGRILHG